MRTPNNGFKKTYPERPGMLALLICHGCQPDTACGEGAFRHISAPDARSAADLRSCAGQIPSLDVA